jgi:hypothetical protein
LLSRPLGNCGDAPETGQYRRGGTYFFYFIHLFSIQFKSNQINHRNQDHRPAFPKLKL